MVEKKNINIAFPKISIYIEVFFKTICHNYYKINYRMH